MSHVIYCERNNAWLWLYVHAELGEFLKGLVDKVAKSDDKKATQVWNIQIYHSMEKMPTGHMRTVKSLIWLRGCIRAVLSGPSLSSSRSLGTPEHIDT